MECTEANSSICQWSARHHSTAVLPQHHDDYFRRSNSQSAHISIDRTVLRCHWTQGQRIGPSLNVLGFILGGQNRSCGLALHFPNIPQKTWIAGKRLGEESGNCQIVTNEGVDAIGRIQPGNSRRAAHAAHR
jgi:hypothetical protein